MPMSRCRPASSAWSGPTAARPASCSRWTPSPGSATSCSSPRATDWARPSSRAPSIRTSSTSTSQCWRRASTRIIRKTLGSKLIRMEFDPAGGAGRTVRTVDVADAERHRFSLTDADVLELARYAVSIEQHYGRPMDIEWGKDGLDGRIYILQARPETVKSQAGAETQQRFRLKGKGAVLASGRAIGQKIGIGVVRNVRSAAEMERVQPGDVLVTDMTDPNWEPVMKRAAAIVTNRGGRTCHAAIIARELGIPAVVGCGHATDVLNDGTTVTVSCAEGDTGQHLRRGARNGGRSRAAGQAAADSGQDHDERRQPAAGLRLPGAAECRRRPGAARVHHQQQHRRAPEGGARLPERRCRTEVGGRAPGRRLRLAARLLRGQAGRRHRDDRRGVLAEAGHRAHVGLQEQRVQEADRRLALRARRREPDARLPRRGALHRRFVPRVLPHGGGRAEARARGRWGSPTSRSWCLSCARWPRPGA